MDVVIRRAVAADAPALTRVAHAAKRYWRYPEAWIRLWRDALTVTARLVEHHPVFCAVDGARVRGFYALSGSSATRELEHFWVDPALIGRGSDPSAAGFYLRMGARRVGEWPSTPRGRSLPLLELRIAPDRPTVGRRPARR